MFTFILDKDKNMYVVVVRHTYWDAWAAGSVCIEAAYIRDMAVPV